MYIQHYEAASNLSFALVYMMMIAFITFKSSLVPLFEGLWSSNSWEFELSGFFLTDIYTHIHIHTHTHTDDIRRKHPKQQCIALTVGTQVQNVWWCMALTGQKQHQHKQQQLNSRCQHTSWWWTGPGPHPSPPHMNLCAQPTCECSRLNLWSSETHPHISQRKVDFVSCCR